MKLRSLLLILVTIPILALEPFFDNNITTKYAPSLPLIEPLDIAVLKTCGNWGHHVTDEEFMSLVSNNHASFNLLYQLYQKQLQEIGIEQNDFILFFTKIWMDEQGFEHIFCGEPDSNKLGGLHFFPRYAEAQENSWAGYAKTKYIGSYIYTIATNYIDPGSNNIKLDEIKGYHLEMNAMDIFSEILKIYLQTYDEDRTVIVETVSIDGTISYHAHTAKIVVKNNAIRTFYPLKDNESVVEPLHTYTNTAVADVLRLGIHEKIKNHTRLTYKEAWSALMYTDEDPNNINNVILLYSGRSQLKNLKCGSGSDCWNREHVWAKSHGFPQKGMKAYTDIHHLRPADMSINSSRGNKDFDIGGEAHHEAPVNTRSDEDSWEPRDEVKGDIARMLFYMDVRYEGTDPKTPDLVLVNKITESGQPNLGKLCTLLQWHKNDPVSDWEQRRNDRIEEIQGNRNPFIDNPEYADILWKSQCE